MTTEIVNIEIHRLSRNEDNPRKDFGDLTELVESIKLHGVLQNLTVVPWWTKQATGYMTFNDNQETDPLYTVVVGHRRLAAAKKAGLTELPCVISNMDHKTQIATMLLENLQREDLTVYEQAQGFQMMLDLGESVGTIATMSGFSETTVRRRVNLLDLDKQLFEKSMKRGATLMDYVALEKIKDIDRKNEVLETIGTKNFDFALRKAIDTEKSEEKTKHLVDQLSTFAEEIDDNTGFVYVCYIDISREEDIKVPEDADVVKYYYTIASYGGINLYREKTEADDKKEEREETPAERERRERAEKLDALARTAFNLRQSFVRSFNPQKKHFSIISAFAACQMIDGNGFYGFDSKVMGFLGHVKDDGQTCKDVITQLIEVEPERMLFVMSYLRINEYESDSYHDYWQMHQANETIDTAYAILEQLDYVMSDDEKALQDGTHEAFRPEDPCYKCKSAHWGCDDCCKTCVDRCNASQRCRLPDDEEE